MIIARKTLVSVLAGLTARPMEHLMFFAMDSSELKGFGGLLRNVTLPKSAVQIDLNGDVSLPEPRLFPDCRDLDGVPPDAPRLSLFSLTPKADSGIPTIESIGVSVRRGRPTVSYAKNWLKGVTTQSLDVPASVTVAAGASVNIDLGALNPAGDVRPAHWINLEVFIPSLNSDTGQVSMPITLAGSIQTITGNPIGTFSFGPTALKFRKGTQYRMTFMALVDVDDGEKAMVPFVGDSVDYVRATFANPAGSNTATLRATGSSTLDDTYTGLARVLGGNT